MKLIIKDTVAVYVDAELTETGTRVDNMFDPTTRSDNASVVQVASLPEGFEIGKYSWNGVELTRISDNTEYFDSDISFLVSEKLKAIDAETSSAIIAGFEFSIDGVEYHFSYDMFDQQNFADSANIVNMIQAGITGLPQSTPWNAYKNWSPETGGELVQLTFDAKSFTEFYTTGALAHKAACMAAGIARKNAVKTALARKATVEEINAI